MSLKIENSRRLAKSRPVCMDLNLYCSASYHKAFRADYISHSTKICALSATRILVQREF